MVSKVKEPFLEYWRLRLLADALEKIVLSEEPKAGISSSMRKAVTQFLAEATLRTVASEGNGCLTSPLLYDSKECAELTNLLDKKALPFLSKWVRIEMNKFGGEVVELFKKKLKYSQVGKERELLEHLGTAAQPLSLISDHIDAEIKEEAALDSEIEKWTKVRAAETEACKMEMGELNESLKRFKLDVTTGKYGAVIEQYSAYVKVEAEYLRNKQTLTKMRQTIAENPSEVTNNLEELVKRLLEKRDEVEAVINELLSRKAKYEALGPEFRLLLAAWNEYGDGIQKKEWILSQWKAGEEEGDKSFNLSTDSSMIYESP